MSDRGATSVAPDRSTDGAEQGIGSIVSGILTDVGKLVENHLSLFRQEIGSDLGKAKQAVLPLALSAGLAAVATGLFAAMLVGLLAWAVPSVPWWGWSGILAALLGIASAILCYSGVAKLSSVNPVPAQSVQTLKESLQCISNQISTDRT